MKLLRTIALSGALALGAFSAVTYTACSKDACKDVTCQNGGTCVDGNCSCPTYYTGANCQTEVRSEYYNTYKGNGTDSDGDTYTNYGLKFYASGSDPKVMGMDLMDNTNAPLAALTVTLQSATTFTVNPSTDGTTSFSGTGTVDPSKASLTLTAKDGSITLVFTFTNMVKQ